MSYDTRISDLANLKQPVRLIARGKIFDLIVFFVPSFTSVPWAALKRWSSYVQVLVGPFTQGEHAELRASNPLLGVYSPNPAPKRLPSRRLLPFYDHKSKTSNPILASVVRQIVEQHHGRIDGPSDISHWLIQYGHRWSHLCGLLDEVLDSAFSVYHAPNKLEIVVTTEVQTISTAADRSPEEPPSFALCEAATSYSREGSASRSSACPCGNEEINPPCRVDILPMPDNQNFEAEYERLALFDDTWAEYTTRPSTALSQPCSNSDSGFTRVSCDTFGRPPSSGSSTVYSSGFAPETTEALAMTSRATRTDNDYEEEFFSWKTRNGKVVTKPASRNTGQGRSRWDLSALWCF